MAKRSANKGGSKKCKCGGKCSCGCNSAKCKCTSDCSCGCNCGDK